jgi:2'-deoxynucleoside 5'-phosphate N-hydrolase
MKIYFAGSIRGGRKDAKQYALIIEILKKYGQVLTEHIGDHKISKLGEKGIDEKKIFKRDLKYLQMANVLVAEVTTPSLGVGYEIGLAELKLKKILCLYCEQKNNKLSIMVVGNPNIMIEKYKTIAEVEKICDSFFRNIKK